MDPSALIFIALALAWAGYLIPKALEHHEEGARSRGIDRFSRRMRILARREPRGRRRTELVTAASAAAAAAAAAPPPPTTILVPVALSPAQERARRRARVLAARRRRRVLDLLLLANVVVACLALLGVVAWRWQAVPAGVVVLWLVVCRVSVRRARRPLMERREVDLDLDPDLTGEHSAVSVALAAGFDRDDVTDEIARIIEDPFGAGADPTGPVPVVGGWDLQPLVVPTYVAKDEARRSVRTIDLDSTGVWSSGRSASDSQLVRDAAPASAAAGAEESQDASGDTSATA